MRPRHEGLPFEFIQNADDAMGLMPLECISNHFYIIIYLQIPLLDAKFFERLAFLCNIGIDLAHIHSDISFLYQGLGEKKPHSLICLDCHLCGIA
ncbi:MAG: hypothetical protein ACXU9U_02980, partial [Parachlamydiaceae bacterium]